MAGYRQLFRKLMLQRRPLESAALENKPHPDKDLAAEGMTRFDYEADEAASRRNAKDVQASNLADRQARAKNLSEQEVMQRRSEAQSASEAENMESLNAGIEWEPEAQAQALKDGVLLPEDLEPPVPSQE